MAATQYQFCHQQQQQQRQLQLATKRKCEFKLKLLSGNGIVLVEAENYEAELFMPYIEKGRICMQNVNPNRRGKSLDRLALTDIANLPKGSANASPKQGAWRIAAGQDNATNSIIRHSTPLQKRKRIVQTAGAVVGSNNNTFTRNSSQSLSPEQARTAAGLHKLHTRALPVVRSPNKVKQLRLVRTSPTSPLTKTTSPVHDVMHMSDTSRQASPTKTMLTRSSFSSSDYRLPPSPIVSPDEEAKLGKASRLKTTAKWRNKCLKPLRTYSKQRTTPFEDSDQQPAAKKLKTKRIVRHSKVLPNYRMNPTQGLQALSKVSLPRKRKLIVDRKTSLSSAKPKKQADSTALLKLQRNKLAKELPITHSQYEHSKKTAFDLLTNSNRRSSSKLNQQFRKRCVNKGASTHRKFKLYCNVAPLQEDRQIREYNRLRAREKALEERLARAVELQKQQQQQMNNSPKAATRPMQQQELQQQVQRRLFQN